MNSDNCASLSHQKIWRSLFIDDKLMYHGVAGLEQLMEPRNPKRGADWHGAIRIRVAASARQVQLVERLHNAGATSVNAGRFGIDAEVDDQIVRDALGLDIKLTEGRASLVRCNDSKESAVEPDEAYVPSTPEYF